MKYCKIVRHNESGGSVNVGLNDEGVPVYTEKNDNALGFVYYWDARHYMEYCKKNMESYKGQTNFEVVTVTEEE